jgi:hypothetical protein
LNDQRWFPSCQAHQTLCYGVTPPAQIHDTLPPVSVKAQTGTMTLQAIFNHTQLNSQSKRSLATHLAIPRPTDKSTPALTTPQKSPAPHRTVPLRLPKSKLNSQAASPTPQADLNSTTPRSLPAHPGIPARSLDPTTSAASPPARLQVPSSPKPSTPPIGSTLLERPASTCQVSSPHSAVGSVYGTGNLRITNSDSPSSNRYTLTCPTASHDADTADERFCVTGDSQPLEGIAPPAPDPSPRASTRSIPDFASRPDLRTVCRPNPALSGSTPPVVGPSQTETSTISASRVPVEHSPGTIIAGEHAHRIYHPDCGCPTFMLAPKTKKS